MTPLIEELYNLYVIDTELVGLKRKLLAGPEEIKRQEHRVEGARNARREAQDAIKDMAAEVDSINLDIKDSEAEVADQQNKLHMVKVNKEYKIVTNRIKELKTNIVTYEEQALKKMEELDAVRESLKEKQDQLAEEEKLLEELVAKVEEEKQSIRTRQLELKQKRDLQKAKVNEVDVDALGAYTLALKLSNGDALAEMVDGICQTCFRKQSPNGENLIMVGKDVKKIACSGCGRLLYVKD